MRPKKYHTMNGDLLIDRCPETDGIRSVSIELCNQQERMGGTYHMSAKHIFNQFIHQHRSGMCKNESETRGGKNRRGKKKKRRGDKFEVRLTLGKGRNNG